MLRYRNLFSEIFRALANDPNLLGVRSIQEKLFYYHLKNFSRKASAEARVKKPRLFVIFREEKSSIEIVRIMQQKMDTEQHLD